MLLLRKQLKGACAAFASVAAPLRALRRLRFRCSAAPPCRRRGARRALLGQARPRAAAEAALRRAELARNPIEGFSAGLVDDANVFEWQVTIMGPPETL